MSKTLNYNQRKIVVGFEKVLASELKFEIGSLMLHRKNKYFRMTISYPQTPDKICDQIKIGV